MSDTPQPSAAPLALLAELTHRCPLGCPYCSNPLKLERPADELDSAAWARVFAEAAALGILHVHLSGGEPAVRRDLAEIVAAARAAGLYSNLITSAVGLADNALKALADAGLDHVQISFQDSQPQSADRIASYRGAWERKRATAAEVVRLKLPLTINVVVHRHNIEHLAELIDMASDCGASRIEIAHVQYYGWALHNRAALMPLRHQVEAAMAELERLNEKYRGRIVIDSVTPDYFARYPKPCLGGWARRSLNITPSGKALPCHAAEMIPGLTFWNVRDHSLADIWQNSQAFNAFRGDDWMREPCRGCARRDIDFGGCRCQAFLIAGDARAADPVCHLSPHRPIVDRASMQGGQDEYERRTPNAWWNKNDAAELSRRGSP